MPDPTHAFAEIDRTVELGREDAVRRLMRWANQNSGSDNLAGLAEMVGLLEDDLLGLDGDLQRVSLAPQQWIDDRGELREQPLGDALCIRKRSHAPLQLLLVGHMDTVFGLEHRFQQVILDRETGVLRGPGVAVQAMR